MLLTALTFAAFTLAVIGISYYKSRDVNTHSQDGYFLAGRGLTGWVIAASLMLTNLSTEQMVGLNGQGYTDNMSVMAWEVGASLALVIVALFFLPRYLRKGYSTIPQFVGERYDAVTEQIVNALFLLGYIFILMPIVLYSGAVGMGGIFNVMGALGVSYDVSIWLVVWAIGLLGCFYTLSGGLKIMAWADTVNGIGLLIGGLMIPVFGLLYIGGGDGLLAGAKTLLTTHPEKFNAIGGVADPVPFATMFTGMFLVNLFYWGTNQTIIQRALAAKNLKEGQKGILLTGVLKLFGPLFLVIPGIMAFHIFGPGLERGDLAYPMLVNTVMPKWLVGFFAAVLFGAILSSFNAAMNSTSTLVMLNIVKPYAKKKYTQKELVSRGKAVAVALAVFAMLVAPLISHAPQGLFQYLQMANGFYNVPIFTLILIGMLNKTAPAWSAKVSLGVFIAVYGATQFWNPLFRGTFGMAFLPEIPVSWHYLHILFVLFIICAGFMLLMGKLYPGKNKYVDHDAQVVNTKPWKLAYIVSFIIIMAVAGLYVLFSPLVLAN